MTPKVYWKPRGSTIAWVGNGLKEKESTYFGGHAFSSQGCQGVWKDFPESFFFSPAELQQELWVPSEPKFSLPKLLTRKDTPSFDEWWMMVNNTLAKIDKDHFRKVVLARQTTLTFASKIDPFQVLKLLTPLGPQTSLFLLQLDDETAFLGASPEKLFHRQERKIYTEALAGTKDAQEEWTGKEFSEIDAVQVFLQDRLMRTCSQMHWHAPQQKAFGTLQHLYQNIEGVLKDGISDEDLLLQLHPTPALGGLPQKEAVAYLTEIEPFCRGWYGGPFGMVSPQETDMAVAIRCALIRGSEMHLFAGAGIVKGSKPDKEWEELDRKIAHFMRHV
jgi:menaquinone-specific isochorismate synthase